MAKSQTKPAASKAINDRRNGKALKKHPKAHNIGATGRTSDGYSQAALQRRFLRRLPTL